MYMTQDVFEQLVAAALDALPEFFRDKMANVEVVVEDWPDDATMRVAGVRRSTDLLGFYHGVPQTRRTRYYGLVLPDKISIYRRPIIMRCRTPEEVQEMAAHVVRHEIAHHFGISDARLHELGAY
jgi:predicted Zn-dependent protease with MMP-like domain